MQDDWRITKSLTLNLGLRYDIQLAPTERHNRQAYFDLAQENPINESAKGGPYYGRLVYNSPEDRYFYTNSYSNFSPKVGFSYLTRKRLVTRGGFALFYPDQWAGDPVSPGYEQVTSLVSSLNGGLNPSSTLSNPFPQGILPLAGNTQGGLTDIGQFITTSAHRRPSSYIEQWMFGFEYSPTPHDLIEASYVGNHGVKVVFGTNGLNLNQLPPNYLSLGTAALNAPLANPFYGLAPTAESSCGLTNATVPAFQLMLPMPQYCDSVMNAKDPIAFSNYNALDLKYRHRSRDLTIVGTYTHSKLLDDTVGSSAFAPYPEVVRHNFDLAAEKSVDPFDTQTQQS